MTLSEHNSIPFLRYSTKAGAKQRGGGPLSEAHAEMQNNI